MARKRTASACPHGRDRRYKSKVRCRKAPKRRAPRLRRAASPAASMSMEGLGRARRRRRRR